MNQPKDPAAYGLPHREPFVFIDTVIDVVPNTSASCSRRFRASEPFFRGHFPGDPLVPGVILTEAMAQTSGIAAGGAGTGAAFRLSAIKQMKFLKPVLPEQEVVFTAKKTAEMENLLQFAVSASVEGALVAEGVVILHSHRKA